MGGSVAHLVHHPFAAPDDVVAAYPSQLHVDLLPHARGRGLGRALLDALFGTLAADGSPGIHLGVGPANTRAIGFYGALGLRTLRETPRAVFMTRPLP